MDRTFVFVDLAGFQRGLVAPGDETAVDVIIRFIESARSADVGRGDVAKTLGDAVMLAFASPDDALVAVRELLEHCSVEPDIPAPRTGIHHGTALRRGDEWVGANVDLAALAARQAFSGQTLATAPIASVARRLGVPVLDLGLFRLVNVTDPIHLFEIELVPRPHATSIDPVGDMEDSHTGAIGRPRDAETVMWFCSLTCLCVFDADEGRPVGPAIDPVQQETME